MKNLFRKILFAGVVLSAGISVQAAEKKVVWNEDYLQTRKIAAEKKLPMLMLFFGSDWCPPCMQLNKNVFNSRAFAAYAQKGKFVLFKADFPRNSQLPEKVARQNQQLMHVYRIQGVPTVILAGPDGKEFARTGFLPVSAQKYIEHLEELLKKAPSK